MLLPLVPDSVRIPPTSAGPGQAWGPSLAAQRDHREQGMALLALVGAAAGIPHGGGDGTRAACPGRWEIPGTSVSGLMDSSSQGATGEIGDQERRGLREKRGRGGKREARPASPASGGGM